MTMKKTTRTRAEAKKLMWEYYRDNKASLPKWIREHREEVVQNLLRGASPEETFWRIVETVDPSTA
jgi:hypothetical protein